MNGQSLCSIYRKMATEKYLVSVMQSMGFLKNKTKPSPVSLLAHQELRTLYAQAAN
jgi:hypothetical protein